MDHPTLDFSQTPETGITGKQLPMGGHLVLHTHMNMRGVSNGVMTKQASKQALPCKRFPNVDHGSAAPNWKSTAYFIPRVFAARTSCL